jgi:hypothetical protein
MNGRVFPMNANGRYALISQSPAQTYAADETTPGLPRGERKRLKRERKRRDKFVRAAVSRALRERDE